MNIKSQAHVEMILSVVIFVGFLIFIFIFIRPYSFIKEDIPLTSIEKAFFNEIEGIVGELSVITGSSSDCYTLESVLDDYGTNFAEVKHKDINNKYSIYFGDFFDDSINGVISCSGNPTNDFTFGVYKERTIVIYDKIVSLKGEYDTNYNVLKQRIGGRDFVFTFKDGTTVINELSVEKNIPDNTDVSAENLPVFIIDKYANIHEYVIYLRAW